MSALHVKRRLACEPERRCGAGTPRLPPVECPRTGSARARAKGFCPIRPRGPVEKVSQPDLLAPAGGHESVPVARHFGCPRLLMFGAIEAQRAIAEGRIDECAVMRLRRLRMHIRSDIFACDASPL